MEEKSEVEMRRQELVDAIRTFVRLKHRRAANREMNEVLPKAVQAFDVAILKGQLPERVDIAAIVKRVVSE